MIDGFGKSLGKRDNQIVIKEKGHELDYFLAEELFPGYYNWERFS